MFIKTTTLALGLLTLTLCGTAQQKADTSVMKVQKTFVPVKKNMIKMNVSALVIKTFSVQFERAINPKTTVAANAHFMPYGNLPFKNTVAKAASMDYVNFNNFKAGNAGLNIELRYYVGSKGAFNGFYIGPYIGYNHYKVSLPINYTSVLNEGEVSKTDVFKGNINTYTWGLQIGSQFKLSKSLYLDWWIAGVSSGKSDGMLTTGRNQSYSKADQASLGNKLNQLKSDVPFGSVQAYKVTDNSATVNMNGSWVGVKGFGINLGYRF